MYYDVQSCIGVIANVRNIGRLLKLRLQRLWLFLILDTDSEIQFIWTPRGHTIASFIILMSVWSGLSEKNVTNTCLMTKADKEEESKEQ